MRYRITNVFEIDSAQNILKSKKSKLFIFEYLDWFLQGYL